MRAGAGRDATGGFCRNVEHSYYLGLRSRVCFLYESFIRCIRQITRRYSLKLVIALDNFDEFPTALFTGSLGKMVFLVLRVVINDGTAFFFLRNGLFSSTA